MPDTYGRIPKSYKHRNYDASNRGPRAPNYEWEKGPGLELKCAALVIFEHKIGGDIHAPAKVKNVFTRENGIYIVEMLKKHYPKSYNDWVMFRKEKQGKPINIENQWPVILDRIHKAVRYDNSRPFNIGTTTCEHPINKPELHKVYNKIRPKLMLKLTGIEG